MRIAGSICFPLSCGGCSKELIKDKLCFFKPLSGQLPLELALHQIHSTRVLCSWVADSPEEANNFSACESGKPLLQPSAQLITEQAIAIFLHCGCSRMAGAWLRNMLRLQAIPPVPPARSASTWHQYRQQMTQCRRFKQRTRSAGLRCTQRKAHSFTGTHCRALNTHPYPSDAWLFLKTNTSWKGCIHLMLCSHRQTRHSRLFSPGYGPLCAQ